LSGRRRLYFNDRLEGRNWLRARPHPPVDETRRRPFYTQPRPLFDVLLHPRPVFAARETLLERPGVKPDILRVLLQFLRARIAAAGHELVVIWPELPLLVGAARRFGRLPGIRVQLVEGIVMEDQLHLIAILRKDLVDGRLHLLAVRAVDIRHL